MNPSSSFFAPSRPLHHGVAGVTALTIGGALLAGVVLLFGDASSMGWLTPTPHNMAAMQACEQASGRAARNACVEAVVARARSRESERRLAAIQHTQGTAPASH